LSQRLDTSDRKDSQILSSNSNSLDLISTNPVDKSLKKFKSTGEKTFTHKSDLFTDVPYETSKVETTYMSITQKPFDFKEKRNM